MSKTKPLRPTAAAREGKRKLASLDVDVQKAYAAVNAMEAAFKVFYILPHEEQDLKLASPLGWYTPGIHEAIRPLRIVCRLPADVRELFTSLDQVLMYRLLGLIHPMLIPSQLDAMAQALPFIPTSFRVFLTTNSTVADATDRILEGSEIPALHVSSVPGPGRTPFENLSLDTLSAYFLRVLEAMARSPEHSEQALHIRRSIAGSKRRKLRKHPLPHGEHNVTAPNEIALNAFGWKFARRDAILPTGTGAIGEREQRYVDRICAAADAVFAARKDLTSNLRDGLIDSRYIIAVASMYWGHFEKWRDYPKGADEQEHRVQLKQALSDFVRAKTYFGNIKVEAGGEQPFMGKLYRALAGSHAADMGAFTSGLAVLASATLLPVLRLEPRLNEVRGELKILAHCVRAEAKRNHDWKASRLTAALGAKMRGLINPEFLKRIDASESAGLIEGMKLVSDLPLELLPTGGVPLTLRYDTSRLPPVPGNLFWQECMLPPRLLPLSAFDEILVVRSFQPNDRLRTMFEGAVAAAAKPGHIGRVRYRFVDVQSEAEFVDAMKSYSGAVFVFDGHGTYDAELGMGSMVVGGKALNVWDLKRDLTLPPIVMFSACDTQPIDGSHSSVATAAFSLGAHAVLGTLFPIDGRSAASFNARLLLRLDQFLPVALKIRPQVTWREVVSGMLRMAHASEAARRLNRATRMGLSEDELGRVQVAANAAINAREADWHRTFVAALATESGRDIREIEHGLQRYCGLTDALKYVQLGNPERLILVKEHPAQTFSRGLEKWEQMQAANLKVPGTLGDAAYR